MQRYTASNRLRDIVADNSLLLPALSRFGITLGFGDSQVATVCESNGVDTNTFLAVINFISGKPFETDNIDISTLTSYLKSAHNYFIDYRLPDIRRRLIEAISSGNSGDISLVILKFYDEYVAEVKRHMIYENNHVFTYVESLLKNEKKEDYSISNFRDKHQPIHAKLRELKEILICHFTADTAHIDVLNSLLFDIIICERDLGTHCKVEDDLFIPAVEKFEKNVSSRQHSEVMEVAIDDNLDEKGDIRLTPRERDIIASIARGMSNKEIADKLCLSVHTVSTHRRNICAKLDIHSASGITIFALLHGLISIDEGKKLRL